VCVCVHASASMVHGDAVDVPVAAAAAHTLKAVVGITVRVVLECEQVLQVSCGKVTLDIGLLVHHTTAERLLVCLPLPTTPYPSSALAQGVGGAPRRA
jgi:hypothetical protein